MLISDEDDDSDSDSAEGATADVIAAPTRAASTEPPSRWSELRIAYREMVSIAQLRSVLMACLFSISVKASFLAESALQFELMEKGIKKEQMLILGLPLLAIEVGVTPTE